MDAFPDQFKRFFVKRQGALEAFEIMTEPVVIRNLVIGEGRPKICIPLTGKDREELAAQVRRAAAAEPDLLEWRADYFEEELSSESIREVISMIDRHSGRLPVIFTVRTLEEGGRRGFPFEKYAELLLAAAENGAALIDVEALREPDKKRELIRQIRLSGAAVISSVHDFEKTDPPEILMKTLERLEESEGDILKMAVMPENERDTGNLMKTVKAFTSEKSRRPVIAMAMGPVGMITRISGALYGSCVTFGTAGEASAPGQIPAQRLRLLLEEVEKNRAGAAEDG